MPMSYPTEIPVSQKSAYKRPYKNRRKRKEDHKKKQADTSDRKFLWGILVGIGIIVVIALGCLVQGSAQRDAIEASALQATP